MSKKATLVVTATPNPKEMESVQNYLQGILPLLVEAGGQLLKRLKVDTTIHGSPCEMVLVMDFDSEDVIKEIFESGQYNALVPTRDKGFSQMNILVTQAM